MQQAGISKEITSWKTYYDRFFIVVFVKLIASFVKLIVAFVKLIVAFVNAFAIWPRKEKKKKKNYSRIFRTWL